MQGAGDGEEVGDDDDDDDDESMEKLSAFMNELSKAPAVPGGQTQR